MIRYTHTPERITELQPDEIFVFGSNQSGRHGKGAAKQALKWGAVYGQAEGLQGRTYGIPTMNGSCTRSLSIEELKPYVPRFIMFAFNHPEYLFLVTEIGCGLAGMDYKQVALLFQEMFYLQLKNVVLPNKFLHKLLSTVEAVDGASFGKNSVRV